MPGPQETAEMRPDGSVAPRRHGRVRFRRLAAVMLSVAAASNCWFAIALILPATLPPGNTFISELAARGQPYSTFFRLADLITGLTLICGVAVGWSRAPVNRWLQASGAALAGYGLLTATDSLLPLDCPPGWDPACRAAELAGTVSWQHQLHSLTGVLETVALLVACTGVTLGTRHSRQWWSVHRLASWILVLQLTIATLISVWWFADIGAVGWPQRIATGATSALLVALASKLAVTEWDPSRPPDWPVANPPTTHQLIVTVFPKRSPEERADQLAVTIHLPAAHQPTTGTTAVQRDAVPESKMQQAGAPVVFLNGLSLPADLWQPVIAAARPMIRAICFDRPGNGNSTGTNGPDLSAQLTQIRAVLAAAGPATGQQGAVVFVAHSHAALAATTLARMQPEMVGGLVLVDPSIPGPLHPIARAGQTAAVALMTAGTRLSCGARIAGRPITWLQLRTGLATPDCYWPPRELRARMASLNRLRATVAELAIESEVLRQESAVAATHPMPPIPVTVLASERAGWPTYFRDRRWTQRLANYARQLSAQGAAVDFAVLPGAHLLPLDNACDVARNVTEMSHRIA